MQLRTSKLDILVKSQPSSPVTMQTFGKLGGEDDQTRVTWSYGTLKRNQSLKGDWTTSPEYHNDRKLATECFYFGSSRGREEVPPAMCVWWHESFLSQNLKLVLPTNRSVERLDSRIFPPPRRALRGLADLPKWGQLEKHDVICLVLEVVLLKLWLGDILNLLDCDWNFILSLDMCSSFIIIFLDM